MTDSDRERAAEMDATAQEQGTNTPLPGRRIVATDAGDVRGEVVTMDRSGAESVSGERVIMNQSGTRTLEARSAQLDRSGVMTLNSERAVMHGGSAVSVVADEARLVKSKAVVVVASQATIDEDARVFLHIGPEATCSQPVLNTAGAAAFGAAFGLVLFLLRSLVPRQRC